MDPHTLYNSDDDFHYHIDPPSPPPLHQAPPVKLINSHKKRRTEVIATKSKPDPSPASVPTAPEDDIAPHQWTVNQVRTLIQIRTADDMEERFRTTKKGHKHIWLTVAKKLQVRGIEVDHQQAQSKYNRVRREYSRRYMKINRSGADPSPLHDWEFYVDLEPSFRNCKQIKPDSVACSEEFPAADDGPSTSSSEPVPGTPSLVFPNRRRKRLQTQDDSNDLADKRFKIFVEHLDRIDAQYQRFTEQFETTTETQRKTAESQQRLNNIQYELAAAKLEQLRRHNGE